MSLSYVVQLKHQLADISALERGNQVPKE